MALISGCLLKNIGIDHKILNKFLSISVLLILLIMGYEFGSTSSSMLYELKLLSKMIFVFVLMLFLLNYIFVYTYTRLAKLNFKAANSNASKNNSLYGVAVNLYKCILESGKYILCVFVGICSGYWLKLPLMHLDLIVNIILVIILFIIGQQLRMQNVSLKNILTNKIGIMIASLICISSIIAGIISAKIVNIDMRTGVVLSSGFGWYTLSGILVGKLASHQLGAAAFFIDFLREIIAIILIPTIGRAEPLSMVAYSGATALDFTLPIIKVNLPEEMLPVAITSGMLLTILVPVIIPLFWAVL